MLVQRARTEIPGHDAYLAHVAMRDPDFGIGVTESRGLVTDWGLQAPLVHYIARQTRSQLSLLLAGRGYFGTRELAPGEVVESDQRLHGDEGYAGTPCELVVIDWPGGGPFGPAFRGPPRFSRIGARDVERLRRLVARIGSTPPEAWVSELVGDLRALGLPSPRSERERAIAARPVAGVYAALGRARARLHEQPALPEIAGDLGLCERQVRRCFDDLAKGFGLTSEGWRDALGDIRMGWVQQLLSVPGLSHARVAELAGFRSQVALCHALAARGATTPGELGRAIGERWG